MFAIIIGIYGGCASLIMFLFILFTSLSENVVSFDIYFDDLHYDEIEQIPSFELWSLFGKCCINIQKFSNRTSPV